MSAAMSEAFPGTGRRYLATFPDFRFRLHYSAADCLTWTRLDAAGRAAGEETVATRTQCVAPAIHLVSWQERNATTVVQVADFKRRQVWTHITRADGSFLRASGSFEPLDRGDDTTP
jgi:hypothetical protein